MTRLAVDPLLTILRKLSRRGATLLCTRAPTGAITWSLSIARDGVVVSAEPVADSVAGEATERGLITRDAAGKWRLSRRGIAKLRGARNISDGPPDKSAAEPPSRASGPSVESRAPRQTRPRTAAPAEGSLEWLRSRRDARGRPLIDEIEYQAGLRLAVDFEMAQMQPRITQGWSGLAETAGRRRAAPGGSVEIGERALAARARLQIALDEIGPDFANLLLDVCCFQLPLTIVERDGHLPQRSAKVLLQFALRALARHYRMLPRQSTVDRSPSVRHWGGEGYRPGAFSP